METKSDHETASARFAELKVASKHLARRLMTIGENRLELLQVELQEERERMLLAVLLALGVAGFSVLAGVALTITLVVVLWPHSPATALLVLTVLYAAAASYLYRRFALLLRAWQTLPATLDQLRKDRAGLESFLE